MSKIIYIKRIAFIKNKTKIAYSLINIKQIIPNETIKQIVIFSNIKFKNII